MGTHTVAPAPAAAAVSYLLGSDEATALLELAGVEAEMGNASDHRLDLAAVAGTQALPQSGAARLGVIVSLQAEADCLRHVPGHDSPVVLVSGGSAVRGAPAKPLWKVR